MSVCPHCDHCRQNLKTGSQRHLDDIALIRANIDHLRGLIDTLQTSRIALLRRLNSLRSDTRNLPVETLSLIFQYAAPSPDIGSRSLRLYCEESYPDEKANHTPIVLGAVCSTWYHIAQSTPQLWTSLVIDVQRWQQIPPSTALLQHYLSKTKHLPFSLELNL
ncbi:hypothetical protein P691DRAFT_671693, partial [Macrolepiota fuliginosa MF-IS2]